MFLVVDFSDLSWEIAEFGSIEVLFTFIFELFHGLDAFLFFLLFVVLHLGYFLIVLHFLLLILS